MENKILRLLVLHNSRNEALGFVTLRENGVEKYSFGKTLEEKKSDYNKLMNELIKTYPEGLEELISNKDTKGIKDFLVDKGYIIDTKDDVITKVTYYKDSYFEVEYAIKPLEVVKTNGSDYDSMADFYSDYNKRVESIEKTYHIKNVGRYKGLIDIHKKKENDLFMENEEPSKGDSYDEFELEESKNNKNIKISKKLVALVTAGAVLVVAGAYKLGTKKEGITNYNTTEITHEINLPTATPIVEVTALPTVEPTSIPTPIPTPTPVPTPVPTEVPTPTPYVTVSPISAEELRLEPTPYPIEAYNPDNSPELWTTIIPNEGEDVVNIGDVNLSDIDLQEMYSISYQNMWDLSNHIFHGEDNPNLETPPMRVHFERLIPGLSLEDKAYIKYFSDLRNEIVYQGFNLNQPEKVLECNKYTIYELIRCVKYNNPLRLKVNGQEIFVRYSDLSYEAQDAIEQICWGNYLLMGSSTVEFNGQEYNQANIGLDIFGLPQEATPEF